MFCPHLTERDRRIETSVQGKMKSFKVTNLLICTLESARQEIHLSDDFPTTVESVGLTDPSLLEDCLVKEANCKHR